MTSSKILVQITKWSASPKYPILKTAENEHGAHVDMSGQTSNAYNLYIVGKEILPILTFS